MKQPIKKSIMAGVLFGISVTILFSCKKENEESARPAPSDKITGIVGKPIATVSPKTGEAVGATDAPVLSNRDFTSPGSQGGGTTDFVDFDDPLSLSLIPDQAKYGFAAPPFYIQQVGNAWVHVKENGGNGNNMRASGGNGNNFGAIVSDGNYMRAFISNYGHYHLNYNFVPCIKQNGDFGKPFGGGCANLYPLQEPRELETHDGTQWIKIYAYDYTKPKRVFDLLRIKITLGPLQLWYKKQNAGWFKWNSLGVGTWDLSAYTTGITEVLISGNSLAPVGFDDLQIRMPAY